MSIPRDERVLVSAEIPFETKQAIKNQDAPMWKVIDEACRMYLGLDDESTESALEREIEDVRDEKEQLQEQIEEIRQQFEQVDTREEDLVEQLETVQERRQDYKEAINEILDEMLSEPNKNIFAWSKRLKELAKQEYGTAKDSHVDKVIGDLRNRRNERNLAIHDSRFSKGTAMEMSTSQPVVSDGGHDDSGGLTRWSPSGGDADE